MNFRWPLVGSVAALLAGVIVAAFVVAFCGGNGEEPRELTATTTPKATRTVRPTAVTRTPGPGTPSATGTAEPDGEPGEDGVEPPGQSPVALPAETPADGIPGETPPADGPGAPTAGPPPLESPVPGRTATAIPGYPPARKTPTSVPSSPATTVTRPPRATPTPTPPSGLPDLVVRDLEVRRDRIVITIGNDGEGDVRVGQTVEVGVRGVVAESLVLPVVLSKGESLTILLDDQLLYKWEKVMGRVDPNNLIPEDDDNNNAYSEELLPDVPLDLEVVAVLAVGTEQHLAVYIRNTTEVPVAGAQVRVRVFRGGGGELTATALPTLNLDPFQVVQIDVFDQVAVRGVFFRIVLELINLPDGDPSNNVFEGTVP